MIAEPEQPDDNRLVFLSEPLEEDLRISGTPEVNLTASSSLDEGYFGAILVDYGPKTRISRQSEGVISDPSGEFDCWGESSATDDGCYRQTAKRVRTADLEIVTKGIHDAANRQSLRVAEPLVPGQAYNYDFPLLPEDYVFPAGHRIGVILVGSYPQYSSQPDPNGARITYQLRSSRLQLPIVGGTAAAHAAGL